MHEEPIFLVASGRSGSTWLQKIINVHPNVVMWGEHAGFITDLARSYYRVINQSQIYDCEADNTDTQIFLEKKYGVDFNPVWTTPFTRESFRQKYRELLINIFAKDLDQNIRWGFKEIRYCDKETLIFLHDLFPSAQFIFLERDIAEVCRSQFLSFHGNVINHLNEEEKELMIMDLLNDIRNARRENEKFKEQLQSDKNIFIDVLYNDLVENYHVTVKKIFDFLHLDGTGCVVDLNKVRHKKIHPTKINIKLLSLIYNVIQNNKQIKNKKDLDTIYKKELDCSLKKANLLISRKDMHIKEMQKEIITLSQQALQQGEIINSERNIYTKKIASLKNELKESQNSIMVMQKSFFWKLKNLINFPIRFLKKPRYYGIKYKKIICQKSVCTFFYRFAKKPDIAVCILFFNKVDQTIECIDSFLQSGVSIYILDNKSDSVQRKKLNDFIEKYSQIKIFTVSEKLEVSCERNYLIEHTKEQWLFFVDNDIIVFEPDWLVKFTQKVNNQKNIEIFVPRLFNMYENRLVNHSRMNVDGNNALFIQRIGDKTNIFPGGASIVSRKFFDKIGLYDKQIFGGFEDCEIAMRAMKKGYPIEAVIIHGITLMHNHQYSQKPKNYDVVKIQYSESQIKQSISRLKQLYGISFDADWREWANHQTNNFNIQKVKIDYLFSKENAVKRWLKNNSKKLLPNKTHYLFLDKINKNIVKEIDEFILSNSLFNKDKKNFLFVIPSLTMGGSEKVALDILGQLSQKNNYNFHIITNYQLEHTWKKKFEKFAINIIHVDEVIGQKVEMQELFVRRYVNLHNITMLLTSNTGLGYKSVESVKSLFPTVYTFDLLHGPGVKADNGGYPQISRDFDTFIDRRIVISDVLRDTLIQQGVTKEKIVRIYNGVDTEYFDISRAKNNVFDKIFKKKKKKILFLGRLSHEKHPEKFIEIALDLKMKNYGHSIEFLIAGDGILMNKLKKMVADFDLSDNIIFLGRVDSVADLLCYVDVLVMTSETEGIPIAVLESLAMGIPVIATNVGGLPEIIREDEEGYLINYDENMIASFSSAIIKLTEDEVVYKKMSYNARRRAVQQFSIKKMGNFYNELFTNF